LAFWIGAVIALVGVVARTRLRETPDFLKAKRQQMREAIEILNTDDKTKKSAKVKHEQLSGWKVIVTRKTLLSYFIIYCGRPLTFYLAYLYFNPMLKSKFGYTASDIIEHNFWLSVILLISAIGWSLLSAHIHPIKIIKIRGMMTLLLMILLPFFVEYTTNAPQLFMIQTAILVLQLSGMPAGAVFMYNLPIYSRFTYASFLYALARALMYIITSFGLVYLGEWLGIYGLWIISIPATIGFLYGVHHFEILERKSGIYPNLIKAAS
jgi:hypothetical protein